MWLAFEMKWTKFIACISQDKTFCIKHNDQHNLKHWFFLNNCVIKPVTIHSDLYIVIDQCLSMSSYLRKIMGKSNSICYIIRCYSKCDTDVCFQHLVDQFLSIHCQCRTLIWLVDIELIEKPQKHFMKCLQKKSQRSFITWTTKTWGNIL